MGFVADIVDPFGFFHDSAWMPGGSEGRSMYGDKSSRHTRNDIKNAKAAPERAKAAYEKKQATIAAEAEATRQQLLNPNPQRLVSSSGLTGNTGSGSSARRKLLGG